MSDYLVGKIIKAVKIASDKMAILFVTDDGKVVARCDADCCSSTWIEHVELPAAGFPAKVIRVDDLDMPDLGKPADADVIDYYGCKITTDRGELIIDYRNESNGYYGGNLVWPDEDDSFYGGVHGQNISTEEWQDITEDF